MYSFDVLVLFLHSIVNFLFLVFIRLIFLPLLIL